MSDSNDDKSALPMPVVLAAVAIVVLIVVAIFAFGGDGSEMTDETTDETAEQADTEEAGENGSDGQTQEGGEAAPDSGEAATPPEDDDTVSNDADIAESDEPDPLPANWAALSSSEKTDLNPYGCWQGTVIRADNGQCSVGGGSSAGYFLMYATQGSHAQASLPFAQRPLEVFVAVPTNSTAEQVAEVLASYKASVAEPDVFYTFRI